MYFSQMPLTFISKRCYYVYSLEHEFYYTIHPTPFGEIFANKKCPAYRRDIFWWRRVDSNHRSESQQIYSLPPLATRELLHMKLNDGAGGRTRTPDLLITNQLLYQLSYTSKSSNVIYSNKEE